MIMVQIIFNRQEHSHNEKNPKPIQVYVTKKILLINEEYIMNINLADYISQTLGILAE